MTAVEKITVNFPQAKGFIVQAMKVGLVVMLSGSPGLGKSALGAELCEDFQWEMIDLRLSQCDPTDLLGFPSVNEKTGRSFYRPMETFPLEGDPLPKGKNGWLLFLDEFNSAGRAVQAAAYKLVLDRMVGQHKLHDNVVIVCAGNLDTDNAIVEPMSTALQSRLIHLELKVDTKAWLQWANAQGIDSRITSYLEWQPASLYQFDANHTDKTYPCPRTWEFLSRLTKNMPEVKLESNPIIAGTIGQGMARTFIGYCSVYADLPKIQQILADPVGTHVPKEPGSLYALGGCLAEWLDDTNTKAIMDYAERLPFMNQVVMMKTMEQRKPNTLHLKEVRKWRMNNADKLFA